MKSALYLNSVLVIMFYITKSCFMTEYKNLDSEKINVDTSIGQPLFCYGCSALLTELHKSLVSSYGRVSVIKTELQKICQANNFVVYKFSPPKMIKACEFILDNYQTLLLESLSKFYKKYKTKNNNQMKEEFCISQTQACHTLPKGEEMMDFEKNANVKDL